MTSYERNKRLKHPWALPFEEIARELDVDKDAGLSADEARKRLRKYGPNRLRTAPKKSILKIFISQIENLIVLLLAVAAALAFLFGQFMEGISIIAVLVINTAIGFFTELKAVRSMEALSRMSRTKAKVRRSGQIQEIPAEELVPGDVVAVEGGDLINADLRLIEASRMRADESSLTGESIPAGKEAGVLEGDLPLAERKNMLFKGTALTGGSGEGIVVSTGMQTELGRITSLVTEAEAEISPLDKRLNRLGYKLIWITIITAGLLVLVGAFSGMEILLIVETAIALAVAAIPEGLPIVATLALARGMWRMARLNALVNRLSAVESLGSVSIICTDKTGTLTENRLTARRLIPAACYEKEIEIDLQSDPPLLSMEDRNIEAKECAGFREAVEIGVLCSNASLNRDSPLDLSKAVGDPLEVALLALGAGFGIHREDILKSMPEVREEAFDPKSALMATFHEKNGKYIVAVKGAPESVLDVCTSIRSEEGRKDLQENQRTEILKHNNRLADDGLRVLAFAGKTAESEKENPYENLAFVGLIGLLDPPRLEVRDAIDSCSRAGVRTVMVTGDQPITAENVGKSIGLIEKGGAAVIRGKEFKSVDTISAEEQRKYLQANIFARISPRQKLDLVELHQRNGAVVAMTGDGVNDAPALKKADIGIAMGKRGTQVAREAADIILKDDAFGTIAVAIGQGRAIFDSIRKFILFLLSGNMGEIMIVGFALMAGARLPLLPLQILYLNMIGDVFPALALGLGKGDAAIMQRPPRGADEPILTRRHWVSIVGYGLLIAASVLTVYGVGLKYLGYESAVTVSFLALAFSRLLHAFNMRDRGSGFIINDVTLNPFVWQALALCAVLLFAAVYIRPLAGVLKLVPPGTMGWSLIFSAALATLLIGQLTKIGMGRNRASA